MSKKIVITVEARAINTKTQKGHCVKKHVILKDDVICHNSTAELLEMITFSATEPVLQNAWEEYDKL